MNAPKNEKHYICLTNEAKHRLSLEKGNMAFKVDSQDEAIELAKEFGGEGAHTFINGILHKASKDLRPLEH